MLCLNDSGLCNALALSTMLFQSKSSHRSANAVLCNASTLLSYAFAKHYPALPSLFTSPQCRNVTKLRFALPRLNFTLLFLRLTSRCNASALHNGTVPMPYCTIRYCTIPLLLIVTVVATDYLSVIIDLCPTECAFTT